jgi:sterol desaturase/sphingolipid hydroxylase (fatty acid hydroxylase superfamily)
MARVPTNLRSEMLIDLRSRHDRLILAATLFAAGVTGTLADPNGPVGIVMFGVAATALLYLIATPVQRAFGLMRNRPLDRPSPQLPTRRQPVARVARGRTTAAVVAAMSALFTLWLTADLARPLVYACWWSFCLLAVWLLTVGLLTASRRFRSAR